MSARCWLVTPDGAYWDLADDTAATPTGRYVDDWIVVLCADRITAQFAANCARQRDDLPYRSCVLPERQARQLFDNFGDTADQGLPVKLSL